MIIIGNNEWKIIFHDKVLPLIIIAYAYISLTPSTLFDKVKIQFFKI